MVLEKVKAILAEQFDVDEDKITNDTDLQEDLGADSLDVVDLRFGCLHRGKFLIFSAKPRRSVCSAFYFCACATIIYMV